MPSHPPAKNQLSIPSPAKLNLFLSITGRRKDGYHELQTLFQLLDTGDTVDLTRTTNGSIQVSPELEGVPHEQNLAYRAAKLLQTHTNSSFGASILIHKQLPMGGGLGGGSSNAASTLLGLNALWGTGLSLEELATLGVTLGADVPVFIGGRSCLAEGIGEQLYPVELVQNYYLVLKPAVEVSTAKIFADPALTRNSPAIRIAAFFQQATFEAFNAGDGAQKADLEEKQLLLQEWQKTLNNDCEAVVRAGYPDVDSALNWLGQHGDAKLTGTGSCIFARFDRKVDAEKVLAQSPLPGFVARAENISPAHQKLQKIAQID